MAPSHDACTSTYAIPHRRSEGHGNENGEKFPWAPKLGNPLHLMCTAPACTIPSTGKYFPAVVALWLSKAPRQSTPMCSNTFSPAFLLACHCCNVHDSAGAVSSIPWGTPIKSIHGTGTRASQWLTRLVAPSHDACTSTYTIPHRRSEGHGNENGQKFPWAPKLGNALHLMCTALAFTIPSTGNIVLPWLRCRHSRHHDNRLRCELSHFPLCLPCYFIFQGGCALAT